MPLVSTMTAFARSLRTGAMDLVFPPRCLACLQHADVDACGICQICNEILSKARAFPACPTCAASVTEYEVKENRCSECRNLRPKIKGMVRVATYLGAVGGLVRRYKYKGREELTPLLSEWLTSAAISAPWFERVEVITSVPTHWTRRVRSPLHVAEALADYVSKKTALPQARLLQRIRSGPRQVGLSHTQRQQNVLGAFALRSGLRLEKPRILLIDDVRTTGATLNECAKVLHRAGAAEIYAAVLVRAGILPEGSKSLEVI